MRATFLITFSCSVIRKKSFLPYVKKLTENLHVKFCASTFENTVISTEEGLGVFS